MLRLFPLTSLILFLVLGAPLGCVPKTETVDCVKFPESAVCKPRAQAENPSRIYVTPPFGLTFTCALLGCEETLTLTVESKGGGSVSLHEVSLQNPDGTSPNDFRLHLSDLAPSDAGEPQGPSLVPSDDSPLEATKDRPLYITITYQPSDGISDNSTLGIKWFDGRIPFEEAEIHDLSFSVSARALTIGEAQLQTESLNFGFTPLTTTATATVELSNLPQSNSLLTVLDARLSEETSPAFELGLGWTPVVNPGESIIIPIHFTPDLATSYQGSLELITNDIIGAYTIPIMGTGHEGALLTLTLPGAPYPAPPLCGSTDNASPPPPSPPLRFHAVRRGETSTTQVEITNHGGTPTTGTVVLEQEGSVFTVTPSSEVTLAPLERVTLDVSASPDTGGPFAGVLQLIPEHSQETLLLPLEGVCEAPRISVATSPHFPPLVETWTSPPTMLSLQNTGTGELLITHAEFDVGSSPFFSFAGPLPLPAALSPDDPPLELPIVLTGGVLGEINASLLVHSTDIDNAVTRISLQGTVVSCDEGCPTPNGSPFCYSGSCEVSSCEAGWHDTNFEANDGCECGEDNGTTDVGAVCTTGTDLGTIGDCGSSHPSEIIRNGTLHEDQDVDLYFVRAEDTNGLCDFLDDSARTSVELKDAPSGLALCAVIQESGNGCGGYTSGFDPSVCGQTRYLHEGSWGGEDSRELTAWVVWRPDASPSCGSYTLRFRGED